MLINEIILNGTNDYIITKMGFYKHINILKYLYIS